MAYILLLFISLLIPCSYCTTKRSITLPVTHFLPTLSPLSSSSQLQILNSFHFFIQSQASQINTPTLCHSHSIHPSVHPQLRCLLNLPLFRHPTTNHSLHPPDLTWLPCTFKYICENCSSPSPSFIPKASSILFQIPTLHHDKDATSRCQDCETVSSNCTQLCPPYIVSPGSGYTGGVLLTETLQLTPQTQVPEIIIGCSIFSSHQPAGVIGFGRGLAFLPNQLGLGKFSICLLPHIFDYTRKTSNLVIDLGLTIASQKTTNLSYVLSKS